MTGKSITVTNNIPQTLKTKLEANSVAAKLKAKMVPKKDSDPSAKTEQPILSIKTKQSNPTTNSPDIITFDKKKFALEHIENSKNDQLKLFSEDLGMKGAKQFAVTTYDHMYNLCTTKKSPHYYENIENNKPVKFHIDIDLKVPYNKNMVLERHFNSLTNGAIEMFNEEFKKHDVKKPEIIILKSDFITTIIDTKKITKISAHIVYKNVIFNDISDMKIFIMNIASQLSEQLDNCAVDKNIYRVGCFRMLHCSKKGKANKLKCARTIDYKYVDEKTIFFDSLITYIPGNSKNNHIINIGPKMEKIKYIRELTENIGIDKKVDVSKKVNTKTKTTASKTQQIGATSARPIVNDIFFYVFGDKEMDELAKMVDNIDKRFLDQYNYWILMTYAFVDLYCHVDGADYKDKIYELWDSVCKKGKGYDEKENNRYFNSLKLDRINANFIPAISNSFLRFKKVIKYGCIKPQFAKYNVDKINSRYIGNDVYNKLDGYDICAIKSPPGTGKTTLMDKIFGVKKVKGSNTNNFKHPMISITSRKNLAEKHALDLGIMDYSSSPYLFDTNKVAITVNSLLKINEKHFKDCYLILDETSKILSYLKSDILNGIRYDVYQIFCNIIMNAKKILLLDADLTEGDLDTIMKIRNLKKASTYYLAINEYKTKTGIDANFYDNPHIVAEMLLNDFVNKVPFICALDSLTNLKIIMNEIKKKAINLKIAEQVEKLIKVYSSQEADNNIDVDDLEHRLGIAFTPIITYGISISSKVPRNVYVFAFKKILTPCEVNQQLHRERNQQAIHIFVNKHIGTIQHLTRDELRKDIQIRINKYNETVKEIAEVGKVNVMDHRAESKDADLQKIFSDMYIDTTFIENSTKINMEYYLKNIMSDMGYNIIDKKVETEFVLEKGGKIMEEISDETLQKFLSKDESINPRTKEIFAKRMKIMRITEDKVDDFNKKIIGNDKKFTDYINLRRFSKNKFGEAIISSNNNDLDECGSKDIYIKLNEYKKITTVLGIKDGLQYNYDDDHKRFGEKIDTKVLSNSDINAVKNIFDIRGAKYKDFDAEGGYERLYKMAVGLCRHLFGSEIVLSDIAKIDKRCVTMHKLNETYFSNIKIYF